MIHLEVSSLFSVKAVVLELRIEIALTPVYVCNIEDYSYCWRASPLVWASTVARISVGAVEALAKPDIKDYCL